MEQFYAEIGSRFRQLLNKAGITQKQLADLFEGSTGTISKIESGKNLPNGKVLLALLTLRADANLNWIFTGQGEIFLNNSQAESPLLLKAKALLTSGSRYAHNLSDNIEDYFRLLELDKQEALPPEGTNNLVGE